MHKGKQCRYCKRAQRQIAAKGGINTKVVWVCLERGKRILDASKNDCDGLLYEAKPGDHEDLSIRD